MATIIFIFNDLAYIANYKSVINIRTIEQPRDQLPGAVFFSFDLPADTIHNRLMQNRIKKDRMLNCG